ncbi:MAG: TRAP transporter fused permease subunit [SAR324 cluster bacterium]|nr:TRAP transporter fused permease subunit [SAR324 cluster bacterium]
MTNASVPGPRAYAVINTLYYLLSAAFFAYLFNYYITTAGGEVLLAFVLVPITYVIYTLDALRKWDFYPRLLPILNYLIAAVYSILCFTISVYMFMEFEELGTVRAGFWNSTDMWLGGAMFILVMEFARQRYFVLFVFNIILILYAVYGWIVPGMFYHPGLEWERIITSMSLEDTTGVFSGLPQLALTLIGSFVLVLAVLRAFGCIDSILKATGQIANKSPYALPQTAVVGSFAVAAVSGSGAANAVTTGSATIPALISAGMPREDAASVETASSLGGQLMPPIMGLSAFLMAEFMERSYFDVVARGYAPALIYFVGVGLGVYLLSIRTRTMGGKVHVEPLNWTDWINISAFLMVVVGLILFMAVAFLPPMFAARYTFLAVGSMMIVHTLAVALREFGLRGLSVLWKSLLRFLDHFTTMTSELTLLLATLAILTSAFVNTGVPPKVGYLLVEVASVNLVLMVLVAFAFGALLGMGLPPTPTYILVALVIVPHMVNAGIDPWVVHFFAFFLAVWGELTPPTSVVAAVTSKIADASFLGTLWRSIILCSSLFVLMAAVFSRPGLVLEPGLTQFGMMLLVLVATIGLTFSFQARFSPYRTTDIFLRLLLAGFSFLVLFHQNLWVASMACIPVAGFTLYWIKVRKKSIEASIVPATEPAA